MIEGFEIIECEEGVRKIKIGEVLGEGDGKDVDTTIATENSSKQGNQKSIGANVMIFLLFLRLMYRGERRRKLLIILI